MINKFAFLVSLGLVATTTSASADETRGWIGVGGRNAFGVSTPLDPDFGAYAMAGVWMLDEHLQPFVRIGWSRGPGDAVTIDTFRIGGGLAAGAAIASGHLWLGGAIAFEDVVAFSHDAATTTTAHEGMIALSLVAQVRVFGRLLVGVEAGPDFLPSPLRAPSGVVEWDGVRLCAGLRLGVLFGPKI